MELDIELPPFIGLCGHPKSGKTTAAEILQKTFGCQILDSGMPLREIAVRHLGLDWDQVMTQEGKASTVNILGKDWQVRKILGDLGQKLEDMFGEEIMPFMAHQSIMDELCNGGDNTYIDPSCRKTQGHYWKRQGGLVIGINNPDAGPSIYAFDKFDESAVDYWILNDGLNRGLSPEDARKDLAAKLFDIVVHYGLTNITKEVLAA